MGFVKRIFFLVGVFFTFVAAENAAVEITVHPQNIRVGLVHEFSVQCRVVPGHHDDSLSGILSLAIKKIENGVAEPVAVVTKNDVVNFAGKGQVHGLLKSNLNYLNTTWKNPEADLAGEYVCDVIGVDTQGKHIVLSESTTATFEYPSREEFVSTLFELYGELEAEKQLLSESYLAGNKTQSKLWQAETRLQRRQLPDDCSPPVVNNGTGCSDPQLAVGYHVIDIQPKDGLGPIRVLCHVRVQGEGWVVFQKRFDGTLDFYKNFHEYEIGFGRVSANTEFWLGLENIRRLVVDNGDENGLRVDMTERGTGFSFTRIYPIFRLGPGDGYTLIVDGYSDGGKGMSENSGAKFSTYDNDHSAGCPSTLRLAGWWFHEGCGFVNLNGLWALSSGEAAMFWYEIYNHPSHSMQATEMKFRPFPSPIRK